MIKNKKKKLKVKVKTGDEETKKKSSVKLGSSNVKAIKKKVKDDEEKRKNRGGSKYFKVPQGKSYLWILPPVSESMNGLPFVDRFMHNNLGPEGKGFGSCMRTSANPETRKDCIACARVNDLWNKARAFKAEGKAGLQKKYETEAKAQGMRVKQVVQVLDVAGIYDKSGKVVDKFPECFGENHGTEDEKHSKCRKCPFLSSCQKGVQPWDIQYGPYKSLIDKLSDDEIDVTNPEECIPMKIKRTGEGKQDTEYMTEWAAPIKIPEHVIAVVEKQAQDLSKLVVPSTEEQMRQMLGEGSVSPASSDSEGKKKFKKKDSAPVTKPKVSKEQLEDMKKRLKSQSKSKKAK